MKGKHDGGDDDEDDSGTPMCRRKKTIPQLGFIYILIGVFCFLRDFFVDSSAPISVFLADAGVQALTGSFRLIIGGREIYLYSSSGDDYGVVVV